MTQHGLTREALFILKVDRTDDGCWEWTGKVADNGYGHFIFKEHGKAKTVLAHRFSYELFAGPIPEGFFLDHLCLKKHCVRPSHLEPVTPGENNRRHYIKQEVCAQGHPLTGDNVYVPPKHPGQRKCRICLKRISKQNYLRRHPAPPSV